MTKESLLALLKAEVAKDADRLDQPLSKEMRKALAEAIVSRRSSPFSREV